MGDRNKCPMCYTNMKESSRTCKCGYKRVLKIKLVKEILKVI